MFLREWFRPPRHLLALFIAAIVLPAIVLAWLAWRTFEQDKALERQRLEDRLETAASGLVASLSLRLDELLRQVQAPASAVRTPLPDDSVLLAMRDDSVTESPAGRLLYHPGRLESRRPRNANLAGAEALEFRGRQTAAATEAFRQLTGSRDPAVQAVALLGLARCLRKAGRDRDALAAYDTLAGLGTFLVEDTPAELLARYARCALLADRKDPDLGAQAAKLYGDLLRPRWKLDRASFEYYSQETRAWLSAEAPPAPDPVALALADAAAIVGQLRQERKDQPGQGRRSAWLHDRPVIIAWEHTPERMTALVRGPSWFTQVAPLWNTQHVSGVLLDVNAHAVVGEPSRLQEPVVVRQAADTGLPWTLRLASVDPAQELASLSGQRNLALAGLAVVGVLVLVGGCLVERALAPSVSTTQVRTRASAARRSLDLPEGRA